MKANKSKTILVVDDEPAVLLVIQQMLTMANYRVLLAGDRRGAIQMAKLRNLPIDLAVVDVKMPGVTASELADTLGALRPHIPILFMSGFVDDDEIIRIKLVEDYAGFIAKPFRSQTLLEAVREALVAPRKTLAASRNGI